MSDAASGNHTPGVTLRFTTDASSACRTPGRAPCCSDLTEVGTTPSTTPARMQGSCKRHHRSSAGFQAQRYQGPAVSHAECQAPVGLREPTLMVSSMLFAHLAADLSAAVRLSRDVASIGAGSPRL